MVRAGRGEVEAFAALVRRYQDRVFTVALRLTGNRGTAEDIAQQAFLRAWQGRAAYDRRWRVSTWLYRIVTNLCADERRRRVRAAALPAGPYGGTRPSPYEELEEQEARDRLNGALGALPPAQRTVLVLRYVDELSYVEIGRICRLPVNTVKSHLRRGKVALRRKLLDYAEVV